MSRIAVSASAVKGRRAGCSAPSATKIPAIEQNVRYRVSKSKSLRDGLVRSMKARRYVRPKGCRGSADDVLQVLGISCTGSGEFSAGFVNKTNACTKKRMGSATWKTTRKERVLQRDWGKRKANLETEGIDDEGSSLRNES